MIKAEEKQKNREEIDKLKVEIDYDSRKVT